jgi:AbiJ N-terminal domain 4
MSVYHLLIWNPDLSYFSERTGLESPKVNIQVNRIDDALKNSLWSAVSEYILNSDTNAYRSYQRMIVEVREFTRSIYVDFFKWPRDRVPDHPGDCIANIRKWYFDASWNKIYDFLEVSVSVLNNLGLVPQAKGLIAKSNVYLARELSGYRFVGDQLAAITNETEVDAVALAAQLKPKFGAVSRHISTAISLYSNRTSPDYRNSIKESICAVEAAARVISGEEKATLGKAINLVDRNHPIHSALKEGLLKIYGYTSDESGIRHSMLEGTSPVDQPDAYFMLVSCSAFCNYLIERFNRLA